MEAGRGEVEKAKGGLPFARCVIFFFKSVLHALNRLLEYIAS